RVFRASVLYYENHMKKSKSRYELIKPLALLVNCHDFLSAVEKTSKEYMNLCDIVYEMKRLYLSEVSKFHHFGMLLKELQVLGFDVEGMCHWNISDVDVLKSQIDLILEFLAFRYPFDEFDNKTGIHDFRTNEFVFIQP
ncbi:MAG: hypothetical protein Q7R95_01910, partial [bacterium]|nr:hypothetical protein [bacterium]